MSNEELKAQLNVLKQICETDKDLFSFTEVVSSAISLIEEVEKYRWHSLENNPNDLPTPEVRVLTKHANSWAMSGEYEETVIENYMHYNKQFHNSVPYLDIIAWRYED